MGSADKSSMKRGKAKAGTRHLQYVDNGQAVSTWPERGTIAMTSSSASYEVLAVTTDRILHPSIKQNYP
jgi:hypothetical protein